MDRIEIVIDGTNFGGKTPLVAELTRQLEEGGERVAVASPYRELEVYERWDDDPLGAAQAIVDLMDAHRARSPDATVLLWDRGWPTCFIATRAAPARRLFLPLPRLTFLLLNTDAATRKKVQKYGISPGAYPWMHHRRLRDESSYEELSRHFADDVRVFRPTLDDDRFDLPLVAREIAAEALATRPPA